MSDDPPGDDRDYHQEFKDALQKYQDAGVLDADQAAPPCPGCGQPLTDLLVRIMWTDDFGGGLLREDTFTWIPGLHQYAAAPSFTGHVSDEFGVFAPVCPGCGTESPPIHLTDNPNGFTYGEDA